MDPIKELEMMERLDLAESPAPCQCAACERLRRATAAPRTVTYFGTVHPAWHVPANPEHDEYVSALREVDLAHARESCGRLVGERGAYAKLMRDAGVAP